MERLYKANGPVDAIGMGYKRTKTFIVQTYVTLHRLIGGLVSPKQLMGPVGILTFSYQIVAAQAVYLLRIFPRPDKRIHSSAEFSAAAAV